MSTTSSPTAPSPLAPRSELILPVALLAMLLVMLVPLPSVLLDLLLSLNLAITILLLLVTLNVTQALDFSVFPSLLLLLTLFRLALNVATTRLILLEGSAGMLVSAFGYFVVGGSLVVGLVIFLILIVIQFVVITRGAGRVSEVAARFVLDAMPGKQMAIDSDLSAGLIGEAEARTRRQNLMREAEFYGTMDGASKFVRGDAIAGIIITAINLVGGILIGVTRGQTLSSAVQTYSILTIGDGLLAQIPALIIATAAGILVTKSTSQTSLGQDIGLQMLASPRPLQVGAFILGGLALAPGLPTLPFLALAGLLGAGAYRLNKQAAEAPRPEQEASSGKSTTDSYLDDFLQSDRISMEIGAQLIPLVDSRRGPGILDRIGTLRKDLARQGGLWVPLVRVRDNIQIEPRSYRILIGGKEVGRGDLRPDQWLAIDPGGSRVQLQGEKVRDPAFGLPALWIPQSEKQRAELGGFTVVDAPSVVITHLAEVVRRHAHELLGREDLRGLLDKVRETSPAVVDELIPNVLTVGAVHRVLTTLLEERVAISGLTRILESLSSHAPTIKDAMELAERVRMDIGRAICDPFRDEQGRVRAIILDFHLEIELRRAVQERMLALDPARLEQLIQKLAGEQKKATARGQDIVLLCDSSIRRPLRMTVARSLRDLSIAAYQEVPADLIVEPVAILKMEDVWGPTASPSPPIARGTG